MNGIASMAAITLPADCAKVQWSHDKRFAMTRYEEEKNAQHLKRSQTRAEIFFIRDFISVRSLCQLRVANCIRKYGEFFFCVGNKQIICSTFFLAHHFFSYYSFAPYTYQTCAEQRRHRNSLSCERESSYQWASKKSERNNKKKRNALNCVSPVISDNESRALSENNFRGVVFSVSHRTSLRKTISSTRRRSTSSQPRIRLEFRACCLRIVRPRVIW